MTRQRGATWLIRCSSPSNLISLQKNLRRENIYLSYLWNNICRRPRKRCESGAQHSPPQSKKRSIELNSDPSTASTCWSSELRGAVPTFGKTDAPPSSPPQPPSSKCVSIPPFGSDTFYVGTIDNYVHQSIPNDRPRMDESRMPKSQSGGRRVR